MEYTTLWITSLIMAILYSSFGGPVYFKYRTLLDPFQKATILIFVCAFILKTIFWYISEIYDENNREIYSEDPSNKIRILPIKTSLGSLVSGMSFIIYHIIIYRVIVEYD
jgi:putative Mn2+ efflux pump MntP